MTKELLVLTPGRTVGGLFLLASCPVKKVGRKNSSGCLSREEDRNYLGTGYLTPGKVASDETGWDARSIQYFIARLLTIVGDSP